ncbi:hypothetical protein SLS53_008314 [Cytospora paraplurivora]|uniref:Uncharacterized protein n=1 Tax=Cytospora paraplurivora TaxID=2898453 RepID=A0AAN9YBQ1_9PEZI
MTQLADYLSFDIMGDICFSSPFGMLDKPDNRYVLDVLPQGVNGLNMSGWMPSILRLKLGHILFAKLNQDMKRYEAFANQQSRKRLAMGDEAEMPDVYSHLLKANRASKDRPLFTDHDLVGESSLLITGGSDTTATAISATFFYLLHNPEAYEQLQAEVHSRFNSINEIVGGAALSSCRWLRACIDEAMRMSPGVPGLLPRQALAGGVEIAGHVFAEGVDLGVCHYAIHHNEAYYPDSFHYRPERWLEGGDNSLVHAAFCPFSIGPRGCVGKSMAIKELMITIARVVWLYEARLCPEDEKRGAGGELKGYGRHRVGEYQLCDMFVSKTDGPVVQFRRRVEL